MCGVAGFISKEPRNLNTMRNILSEIGIRGLHSTGVSWLEDGEIKTKIEKVPHFKFEIPDVETTSAIFHTRYSTSNIDYPQPVYNEDKSVVHNGVITQLAYEHWETIFGYGGTYRCDSVLLLDTEKHPLEQFEDSSMAVIELTKESLTFYRNGQRPLYYTKKGDVLYVASTRLALGGECRKVEPGVHHSVSETKIEKTKINLPKEWQI